MEQAVINILDEYGIQGSRKPEYRGVWINNEKVSAVGVHLRRWITTHGLSLNVNLDKNYFHQINPCGIKEFGITSLEDHVTGVDIKKIKKRLIISFEQIFEIEFKESSTGK